MLQPAAAPISVQLQPRMLLALSIQGIVHGTTEATTIGTQCADWTNAMLQATNAPDSMQIPPLMLRSPIFRRFFAKKTGARVVNRNPRPSFFLLEVQP